VSALVSALLNLSSGSPGHLAFGTCHFLSGAGDGQVNAAYDHWLPWLWLFEVKEGQGLGLGLLPILYSIRDPPPSDPSIASTSRSHCPLWAAENSVRAA